MSVFARGALIIALVAAVFVAFVAIAGNDSSDDQNAVTLIADCAVDPSADGCRRPSFMDMINGINNRAQGNAIRQKKVREELLKEESRRRLEAKARGQDADSDLKKHGLDISSKGNIDTAMKEIMKTGGKAAVAAKVAEIRQQILDDSGKLFHYGKKAGYLPPPQALKKLN